VPDWRNAVGTGKLLQRKARLNLSTEGDTVNVKSYGVFILLASCSLYDPTRAQQLGGRRSKLRSATRIKHAIPGFLGAKHARAA